MHDGLEPQSTRPSPPGNWMQRGTQPAQRGPLSSSAAAESPRSMTPASPPSVCCGSLEGAQATRTRQLRRLMMKRCMASIYVVNSRCLRHDQNL